ncbi:hypothetical protein [Natrinema soli]|uniref:Transposase n=1 Tax=Natrinema soli TaxID=1930624 RepID=A0ABD5SH31_9EURY|nr:hypothetical protein [Natrinema soli]
MRSSRSIATKTRRVRPWPSVMDRHTPFDARVDLVKEHVEQRLVGRKLRRADVGNEVALRTDWLVKHNRELTWLLLRLTD